MKLKVSRFYRDALIFDPYTGKPLGNRSNSVHVCKHCLDIGFFIGIEMVDQRFMANPANHTLAIDPYRKLNRLQRFIRSELHGITRFQTQQYGVEEKS